MEIITDDDFIGLADKASHARSKNGQYCYIKEGV